MMIAMASQAKRKTYWLCSRPGSGMFFRRFGRGRTQDQDRFWNPNRVRSYGYLFAYGNRRDQRSRGTTVQLVEFAIQWSTVRPLPTGSSSTSSRCVTAMNRVTFTSTSKETKPSRTRAPQTSFSPNRNSRATECLAPTPWRDSAQTAAETFSVLFGKSWSVTCR